MCVTGLTGGTAGTAAAAAAGNATGRRNDHALALQAQQQQLGVPLAAAIPGRRRRHHRPRLMLQPHISGRGAMSLRWALCIAARSQELWSLAALWRSRAMATWARG